MINHQPGHSSETSSVSSVRSQNKYIIINLNDKTRMVKLPATAAIEYVAACCINN